MVLLFEIAINAKNEKFCEKFKTRKHFLHYMFFFSNMHMNDMMCLRYDQLNIFRVKRVSKIKITIKSTVTGIHFGVFNYEQNKVYKICFVEMLKFD